MTPSGAVSKLSCAAKILDVQLVLCDASSFPWYRMLADQVASAGVEGFDSSMATSIRQDV